jgi:uncharacterized membrane protein
LLLLSMIGLGLGLSMGVDIVTLDGDIQRMNTVFKFYLHVWVLFALAAAFMTWQLMFVLWRSAFSASRVRLPGITAQLGAAGLAALVIGALVYPIVATPVRLNDRFSDRPPTLDGTAYMRGTTYDDGRGAILLESDLEGIRWLRQNVEGTPAIVEGCTDLYRWGGTLGFMVDERMRHVDDFYRTTNVAAAQAFLKQYGVQYIMLGKLERLYYPADGLQKFAAGLNGAIEAVFTNSDLTIYRVRPEARGAQSAAVGDSSLRSD